MMPSIVASLYIHDMMKPKRWVSAGKFIALVGVGAVLLLVAVHCCDTLRIDDRYDVDPYIFYEDPTLRDSVVLDGDPRLADHIVISKEYQTLTLYDIRGCAIRCIPVAVGAGFGNKQMSGDLRTPEGVFLIDSIHDASGWGQNTENNGYILRSYGNWFIRLSTPPHYGIGIHATIRPHTIGTRATEGCTTMHTDSLDRLQPLVRKGMRVIVETSLRDMAADGRCAIIYRNSMDEYTTYKTDRYYSDLSALVLQDTVDHMVQRGDTHLSLAVKYQTTRRCIEALNPGVDMENLRPGQIIRVRGGFNMVVRRQKSSRFTDVVPAAPAYYVTTEVDTFGRIAVMHNSSVARIQELNPDITPDELTAGMTLRVR